MAVNSSGSTDSDPEAPPRRRRPAVKKKAIVEPNVESGVEAAAPASVTEEAPARPARRKVRRAEPVVESEPEGFGFDPEEFLPPAVAIPPSRPSRSRAARSEAVESGTAESRESTGSRESSGSRESAAARESAASREVSAAREESGRAELGRAESGRAESGRAESGRAESGRRESGRAESGRRESTRRELPARESQAREPQARETNSRESGARESGSRESGSRESGSRESGSRESGSRGEGARRESSRREGPRRDNTRRDSTRRPAPAQDSTRRPAPAQDSTARQPSTREPQGDDLFNNEGDRGYSDRYYSNSRSTEDSEVNRRTDGGDEYSSNRPAGDYSQNRESGDADLDNLGPAGESVEGGEGEGSEFQRRRRRRRRPRSGGGRNEGSSNSAPPSQSHLGSARFNNANGRNSQRGGSNSGGSNRPSRGPGRSSQGGGGSRSSGGGREHGSREGGPSREGGRSSSYRERAPREYSQERGNYSEQAMADIPGTAVSGVLELHPKGYGFLRDPANNYSSAKTDPFVSGTLIERSGLREGVLIKGEAIPGPKGQGPRLKSVESVEGRTVEEYQKIKTFDTLTAINPHEQIILETGPMPITMRVIDLLCPIGKGQRALIVAPPRTGKTMLLQDIANAVSKNHPEMYLIVLLIDERPEEVTEMRRNVRGEVIASSMDRDVESHVRISQLIIERGKRIAEAGGEVFILLDSITRTARAFNKWVGNTGRTTTGGLDVKALDIPKKMFGTARLFDEGGSLTIAATALIETGSRMDDVIFQEFKGTGNMEMVLSRNLADRRIWPAIDIQQSGTRREEKILTPETMEGVTMLRRSLLSMNSVEGMEQLTKILQKYPSNKEFLSKIRSIL